MFMPRWLLTMAALPGAALWAWTGLLASARNPLPFPDSGPDG